LFGIAKFKFSKTDSLAPNRADAKKHAQYIWDFQKLNIGIVGILFHEGLVLNSLEQSRSYPISSEIARDYLLLLAAGPFTQRGPFDEFQKIYNELKPKMKYVSSELTYSGALSVFSFADMDSSGFKEGKVFILDGRVAESFKARVEYRDCLMESGRLSVKYRELDKEIDKIALELSKTTEYLVREKLNDKMMDLSSEKNFVWTKINALYSRCGF
jgi:hypothetical protein